MEHPVTIVVERKTRNIVSYVKNEKGYKSYDEAIEKIFLKDNPELKNIVGKGLMFAKKFMGLREE